MKNRKSFTLMEMMVVLSVFAVISGITFTALKLNDTYRDTILTQLELYRKAKKICDTITKELSLSQINRINITDSNPDVLTFQIPLLSKIDDNYTIPWGAEENEGYYIRYQLIGDELKREILDSTYSLVSQQTVTKGVADLQFSSDSESITINFTLSRTNIEGRVINFTSQFKVYLAN